MNWIFLCRNKIQDFQGELEHSVLQEMNQLQGKQMQIYMLACWITVLQVIL
jgi:hypothetical protein